MEAVIVALIGAFATIAAAFISRESSKGGQKQQEIDEKQRQERSENLQGSGDRARLTKKYLWWTLCLGGIPLFIFAMSVVNDPSRSVVPTSELEEMILEKYDKKTLYQHQIGEVVACFCIEDKCEGNLDKGDFLIDHGIRTIPNWSPSPGYRCE
ncbi:hypothetical protein [Acaryochloris thomasi]|uniref:hypothetical protein n=1 Tax=Acaryochloris thomasi TaxID=2929456 RepID=UPI000DA6A6B1|nr:hypothetical protein [Acaryochloris thomasi]